MKRKLGKVKERKIVGGGRGRRGEREGGREGGRK